MDYVVTAAERSFRAHSVKTTLKMAYMLLHQLGRRKAEEHLAPSGLLRKQGSDWNIACGTE